MEQARQDVSVGQLDDFVRESRNRRPSLVVFDDRPHDPGMYDDEGRQGGVARNNTREDGGGWNLDIVGDEDDGHEQWKDMKFDERKDLESLWMEFEELLANDDGEEEGGRQSRSLAVAIALQMKELLTAERAVDASPPDLDTEKEILHIAPEFTGECSTSVPQSEMVHMTPGAQMMLQIRFGDNRIREQNRNLGSLEILEMLRNWRHRLNPESLAQRWTKSRITEFCSMVAVELLPTLLVFVVRERDKRFLGGDRIVADCASEFLLDLGSFASLKEIVFLLSDDFLDLYAEFEHDVIFRSLGVEIVRLFRRALERPDPHQGTTAVAKMIVVVSRLSRYSEVPRNPARVGRLFRFTTEMVTFAEVLSRIVDETQVEIREMVISFVFSQIWQTLYVTPTKEPSSKIENQGSSEVAMNIRSTMDDGFVHLLQRLLNVAEELGWGDWLRVVVQDQTQDPTIELSELASTKFLKSCVSDELKMRFLHWSPRNSAAFTFLSSYLFPERDRSSRLLSHAKVFLFSLPYLVYMAGNDNPRIRQAGVCWARHLIVSLSPTSLNWEAYGLDGTMQYPVFGNQSSIYQLAKALGKAAVTCRDPRERNETYHVMKALIGKVHPLVHRFRMVQALLLELSDYLPLVSLLVMILKDCLCTCDRQDVNDYLSEVALLHILPRWLLPRKELTMALDVVVSASSFSLFMALRDQDCDQSRLAVQSRQDILDLYLSSSREALAHGVAARARQDTQAHERAVADGILVGEAKVHDQQLYMNVTNAFQNSLMAISNLDGALDALRKMKGGEFVGDSDYSQEQEGVAPRRSAPI
uniref:Uncharacterized protein n=1 Tax=Compsopogon caeruleus TaxID=31354 RepID=A0A7S1XH57_9RHOD|mmetsp:Transcript_8984/g.18111  ORF Transcript_8984/g.18111 Transcript_8984/m.18111 type:complete len:813 (+) Transcript_8984:996-3434(+)